MECAFINQRLISLTGVAVGLYYRSIVLLVSPIGDCDSRNCLIIYCGR